MNLFEIAVREKYRFPYKGMISTEDLWDLSVTSLDSIFKTLNKERKNADEESLLDVKDNVNTTLENKIAIIKYVVNVKQTEAAEKLLEREKKQQKQKIMNLIAKKQDETLENMSQEELLKKLSELE